MKETLSEELLKKFVAEISYEISLLRWCANYMRKNASKEQSTLDEWAMWCLAVEGLAAHTRVLYHFFYDEKREKDDILAKDFLDEERWEQFKQKRTPKCEFDKKVIITKCDKQLAHLSAARVTRFSGQNKGWNSSEIRSMMEVTIQFFCEALCEDRKIWFKDDHVFQELLKARGM